MRVIEDVPETSYDLSVSLRLIRNYELDLPQHECEECVAASQQSRSSRSLPDVADFGATPTGGLIILPDAFTAGHRDLIIALAARFCLPAIYPLRVFATSGGLVSDGGDSIDIFRRAASYVDRILKGANPGDLPVQAPTKFELVINLKTANALGRRRCCSHGRTK
jgi:hypothetical protein